MPTVQNTFQRLKYSLCQSHKIHGPLFWPGTCSTPPQAAKHKASNLIMTVKRRNHGRNKHGRGHVNRVRYSYRKKFQISLASNKTISCNGVASDACLPPRPSPRTRPSRDSSSGMCATQFCSVSLLIFVCPFRNIVDSSALRDIKEASAYENYQLPKLYIKQYYCIEAAVHQRIVRVRSALDRKNRLPPVRVRPANK
jgi:small subunit ribosomal protein S26e